MMGTNKDNHPQGQDKKSLILLTAAAVEKVQSMMTKEDKAGFGLRVGVVTGGCAGMSYDLRFQKEAYENDIVIEQDGLPIFVHPDSVRYLFGLEIDYIDTLKESGFKYKNPNASKSCSCGTSFS